ncbi:hypothetical protein [Nostoc sp. FACHB-110]|uniref:hypothetical protein n=1 Tax=Nostoc sp. FACHB-110 TaxID=2692834 RepID=UPI001F54C64C|nr:hypothetical protein [Nostoc sp. FACHB-110]
MMNLQELIDSINSLPTEEQDYLFEFLLKKKEESRGDKFWQELQNFRNIIQSEDIIFTDEDFTDLRDKSVGREIDL